MCDDIKESTAFGNPTLTDKFHVVFIGVYVAFAGIYWLPGISANSISQAKIVTYGVLFFIGSLKMFALRPTREQLAILFGLTCCALAAFVTNSLSSDVKTALYQAQEFAVPALWLVSLYGVKPRAYQFFFSVLTVTMTMFLIVSLYPVGVYVNMLPNFYPPESLLDYMSIKVDKKWALEAGSVLRSGFVGSRTGWGAIVAFSALLTVALYLRARLTTTKAFIVALVVTGAVSSIVVTGARGGTLALLAVSAYGIAVTRGLRWLKFIIIIGVTVCLLTIDITMLLPEGFSRGFDVAGDTFKRLNAATTGRFETYRRAFEQFASSPIIGVGPEQTRIGFSYFVSASVHNIWLRALAESGLFLFVPMLIVSYRLLSLGLTRPIKSSAKGMRSSVEWPDASLVILCGLVLGLAEPRVMFGSFNANVVFWTAVWMALSRPRIRNLLDLKAKDATRSSYADKIRNEN
jgi:O-antigen ligase